MNWIKYDPQNPPAKGAYYILTKCKPCQGTVLHSMGDWDGDYWYDLLLGNEWDESTILYYMNLPQVPEGEINGSRYVIAKKEGSP